VPTDDDFEKITAPLSQKVKITTWPEAFQTVFVTLILVGGLVAIFWLFLR
jgi:hypothetical protein